MTFDVVKTIKDNRLDGFATNKAKADQVEKAIQGALMTSKYYGFGYQKLKQLVNPLLELAKRHFATDND
jgi:type I restriction enzyme R subunit